MAGSLIHCTLQKAQREIKQKNSSMKYNSENALEKIYNPINLWVKTSQLYESIKKKKKISFIKVESPAILPQNKMQEH